MKIKSLQYKFFQFYQQPSKAAITHDSQEQHQSLQTNQQRQEKEATIGKSTAIKVIENQLELELECEASVDGGEGHEKHEQSFNPFSDKGFDQESGRQQQLQIPNSQYTTKDTNQVLRFQTINTLKLNSKQSKIEIFNTSQRKSNNVAKLNEESQITPVVVVEGMNQVDINAQLSIFEHRYCTICQQNQLIRSRHCKSCNHCVAMYDHHCPWVGNCIGERNKFVFYWYLFVQLVEITLAEIIFVLNVDLDQFKSNIVVSVFLIFATIGIVFFFLMVFSLLCYHTYIGMKNMTTWEHVSWHKISYLKDFPQSLGSPFSGGIKQNLKIMCRCNVKTITNWDRASNKQ